METKAKLIHPKGTFIAHEAADIFPMMTAEEQKTVIAAMKEHGYNKEKPIVLLNGKVLDGRNRYFCAIEAGVPFVSRQYDPAKDGASPVQFAVRENLHRRQMTASQRAAAAQSVLPLLEAEAQERQKASQFVEGGAKPKTAAKAPPAAAIEQKVGEAPASLAGAAPTKEERKASDENKSAAIAATMFGTSATMVKQAKRLKKNRPDLYDKVLENTITVSAAIEELDADAKKAREEKKKEAEKEQRKESLALIGENYGEESEIYLAIKGRKILKDHDELVEFAATPKAQTKPWLGLIAQGWTLSNVKKYLAGELTAESTIDDLINTAIAKTQGKKGDYSATVNGYKITVKV